jgi:polar amino acid transport system substrate-binding protein
MSRFFFVISLLIAFIQADFLFAEPPKPYAPADRKLIVAVVEDPPMMTRNQKGDWTGFNADLWRYIARDMGARYEFKETSFKDLEDGLRTGKIDLCAAPLYETSDRQQFLDFSTFIGSTRQAVAVLPEKDTHPFLAAVKILLSWGLIQVILLFVAGILFVGSVFWLMERKQNPDQFGGKPLKGMATGVYWVGSTLVSGICTGVSLKSAWGRFLGLIWILAGAVAFGALTASLASTLIEREQHLVYTYDTNSLKRMHLGAVKGTTYESILKKMGGSFSLYERTDDGLRDLLERKIDGFFSNERLMVYEERKLKKKISVHLTTLNKMRFAFAFPKGSPLRERVNISLMEIMEGPEWEALAKRYGFTSDLEQME